MLTFILKDIRQHTVILHHPLRVSLSFDDQAPADYLTAVFAVSGKVPLLSSIEVKQEEERIFFGYIDEQTEESSQKGHLLSVTARSLAAVLLDNEAQPQQYCMPSMPLLMQRHFIPLGFTEFKGSSSAYSGQLTITKGMSEWAVLQNFCRCFVQTEPKIRRSGVIDITGQSPQEMLVLSDNSILSCRHVYRPYVLFSDIWARTRVGGDYSMPFISPKAQKLGILRRRYVSVADSRNGTVLSVKEMLHKTEAAYERLQVTCSGCFPAEPGTLLRLNGQPEIYRIRTIRYTLDSTGETTSIEAERKEI